MIENLIVNGCSFTDDQSHPTWATFVAKECGLDNSYYNIAAVAAGNYYICTSTIDFLEREKFNPANTMVIIMWSGTGRKDLSITEEWWYHLMDDYQFGRNHNGQCYIFSGGLTNSWTQNKNTKKIFEWLYKLSDPTSICHENIINFINLENYLKVHGYQYKFTSYVNYWNPDTESNFNSGNYSIGYFLNDQPIYQNYDFLNWFFINDQRDCLAEFAKNLNALDNTGHPTTKGHYEFAKNIVVPHIKLC
jgi:hypothetical protein